MQFIETSNNIEKSIIGVIQIIKENFTACMLNFLIATFDKKGKRMLFATKFALGLKTPSLFYLKNKDRFSQVQSAVLEEHVVDKLLETVQITEVSLSYEDVFKPESREV